MSEFLVGCVYLHKPADTKKKILMLKKRREYREKIIDLFDLPKSGQYQIQQFNEKFKDWIEVEKWQDLPDGGGRLRIIVKSSMKFCFTYLLTYLFICLFVCLLI